MRIALSTYLSTYYINNGSKNIRKMRKSNNRNIYYHVTVMTQMCDNRRHGGSEWMLVFFSPNDIFINDGLSQFSGHVSTHHSRAFPSVTYHLSCENIRYSDCTGFLNDKTLFLNYMRQETRNKLLIENSVHCKHVHTNSQYFITWYLFNITYAQKTKAYSNFFRAIGHSYRFSLLYSKLQKRIFSIFITHDAPSTQPYNGGRPK